MNELEIEQYMKLKQEFTIPEIQQKFHLTYGEVRNYFYGLQETHEIILKKGHFCYNDGMAEQLEFHQAMLWDCIQEGEYPKATLKRKYSLDNKEMLEFEKWLKIHHHYDFVRQEILITEKEFIEYYGNMEESREANQPTENTGDIAHIMELLKNGDQLNVFQRLYHLVFCDILNDQLMMTKKDFLEEAIDRLVEQQKDPSFKDEIFELIIEDVKKMTDKEFEEIKVMIIADL